MKVWLDCDSCGKEFDCEVVIEDASVDDWPQESIYYDACPHCKSSPDIDYVTERYRETRESFLESGE